MRRFSLLAILMTVFTFAVSAQGEDVKKSDAIMEESLQNYEKAAQLYEEAALAYEANGVLDTTCWYRAGVCNVKMKDYAKALTFFKKLESQNIITGELLYSLGETYYGLKKFKESETYLLKAIEADRELAYNANKKLVLVSYNSKQFNQAVAYSNNALAINARDVNTLYLKGLSFEQLGNVDSAVVAMEQLLEVKPNHSNGIRKLGILYAKQVDKKYDKEKKRYAAMKSPTRVDYHNTTKKLEAIGQEYGKAIVLLEKSLAKKPNDELVKSTLESCKGRKK